MNKRLFLYSAFFFVALLLYESWVSEYSSVDNTNNAMNEVPLTNDADESPANTKDVQQPKPKSKVYENVEVTTENLKLKIDLESGSVIFAELLNYKNEFSPDSANVVIIDRDSSNYIASANLQDSDGNVFNGYKSPKNSLVLDQGDTLTITRNQSDGIAVKKRYYNESNPYLIYLDQTLTNNTIEPIRIRQYNTIQRGDDYKSNAMLYTFTGAAYYDEENKFNKIDFDEIKDQNFLYQTKSSWISMLEHYFFTAWIPQNNNSSESIYTRDVSDSIANKYLIGIVSSYITVKPGDSYTFSSKLYVGPKLSEEISSISPGLDLTVDYGVLTFISAPLFWVLSKLYVLVGNWGWSIIMLTLLIKLLFYKLSETSYKSMAKMKKLTPRMTALKERYGDDKKKFSEALMKVYKEEKVNPLGGCLPILIQIPVFIALYWVIIESVEMRHAPFVGWIEDLSSKDPFFVLPILMGLSMFIQQKLNPPPADPTQQKIFMFLPIIFTLLFATFPSGLVLYWFVNNILSIAQQYVINKRLSV